MRIADLLRRKRGRNTVVVIAPEETLERASKLMTDRLVGALVVCDRQGRLFGLIAERDIVRALAFHGPDGLDLQVQHFTPAEMPVCQPSDAINDVVRRAATESLRYLVVKDEGRMVGIVSVGDLLKSGLKEPADEPPPSHWYA